MFEAVRRWSIDSLTSKPEITPVEEPKDDLFDDALEPLHLNEDFILTNQIAEEIRLIIPPRLQLQSEWECIYALSRDGASLQSLYSKCKSPPRCGFVIAVESMNGEIFGAYLSHPPHISAHYYGSGECFLWKTSLNPSGGLVFSASMYGGVNEYFIYGEKTFLGIGAGDGRYGLWLDESLDRGQSQFCLTFGNEPLSSEKDFGIKNLACWRIKND